MVDTPVHTIFFCSVVTFGQGETLPDDLPTRLLLEVEADVHVRARRHSLAVAVAVAALSAS